MVDIHELPVALNDRALPLLPATVAPLGYRREHLTPAVVHIGVGAFHRAHQAVYLDDLARLGHTGWGLIGIGLHRPEMGRALRGQDGLYLAVERHDRADRARVIGAMIGYLFAPSDPDAVLDVLTDRRTRIVTLTITGAGYCLDPATGGFAPDAEAARDLEAPHCPTGALGYLVEALDRRRRRGDGGFTILSCDNLPDNGAAARTAVLSFARLRDPELESWIDDHVTFPSSMVDRITPQTSAADRDEIVAAFGVADDWPVIAEPYRQWVVEDRFCRGRPPLDLVGVQLVDDVTPYQTIKTRLLNASHCALGFLGSLAGHTTTVDALRDPVFHEYLAALMAREIAPLLPTVSDLDLDGYQRATLVRLANPRMRDQLTRLTRRGASKVSHHLVPSIRQAVEDGRPRALLVLAVAGWVVLEADEQGTEPEVVLSDANALGPLTGDAAFEDELRRAVKAVRERGARDAIKDSLTPLEGAA